jgi:chromosomal replication initiation ATPase DnaA
MEVRKTPKEERLDRIAAIARRHCVPLSEITGDRRYRQVVRARRAICIMLRNEGLTTPQIGSYINRDSTSVCNLLGTTSRAKQRILKGKADARS